MCDAFVFSIVYILCVWSSVAFSYVVVFVFVAFVLLLLFVVVVVFCCLFVVVSFVCVVCCCWRCFVCARVRVFFV